MGHMKELFQAEVQGEAGSLLCGWMTFSSVPLVLTHILDFNPKTKANVLPQDRI